MSNNGNDNSRGSQFPTVNGAVQRPTSSYSVTFSGSFTAPQPPSTPLATRPTTDSSSFSPRPSSRIRIRNSAGNSRDEYNESYTFTLVKKSGNLLSPRPPTAPGQPQVRIASNAF